MTNPSVCFVECLACGGSGELEHPDDPVAYPCPDCAGSGGWWEEWEDEEEAAP